MPTDLLLVTIPASHYCDKARWALQRAGLSFREEGHAPLFSRLATRRRGRWSSVPFLVTPHGVFADSTEILRWVDGHVTGAKQLFPEAAREEVEGWETLFDEKLGPHTRRVGYAWVLGDRKLSLSLLGERSVPAYEVTAAKVFFPVFRQVLRRGMRIDAAGLARSIARVNEVFDQVGAALGDGRRYLVAGRFTAADLTFAALAAPVLAPAGYPGPLPGLEDVPPDARAHIERWRGTVAGQHALRLYAEEREPF